MTFTDGLAGSVVEVTGTLVAFPVVGCGVPGVVGRRTGNSSEGKLVCPRSIYDKKVFEYTLTICTNSTHSIHLA